MIFVIIIIGILAAVAVPKFLNLKQSAEAANIIKQTKDAAQMAIETGLNLRDLEGKMFDVTCDDTNTTSFCLKDIVSLEGKGWKFIQDTNNSIDKYVYNDTATNNLIAEINMSNNEVNYSIDCNKFNDQATKQKCVDLLGNPDNNKTTASIKW